MPSPGERIKTLRNALNLTQDELSEELQCTKQSIYRYENNQNKMDSHILINTAQFFDVSTDYLLGISSHKNDLHDPFNIHNPIFYDEDYFWIFKNENDFGGHTQWVGITSDGKEERALRPIIPEKAFKLCKELHGPPLIINNINDVSTYLKSDGNAFVRKSICQEYLPQYLKLFISDIK
ncbi:helix-turn-helix domain-containing protein [Sporosarcina sp. FA15]|uniref:helix-turn-helix domain-containing protein n=1 Tax=Sporosarcina sp. FA15 TaxID=3413031 RepID=UPI003F65BD93